MIQILGLREFEITEDGKTRIQRYDAFHKEAWRAPDIFDLFLNMEEYIKLIPAHERWNLYYTVANCTDEKRKFLSQDVIPLDIDGIVKGTEGSIVDCVCAELGLDKKELGVVYSGNGVHILIAIKTPITEASYIANHKIYYKAFTGRVNHALYHAGLSGNADTTAFSEARLLGLPFTVNRKSSGDTERKLIYRKLVPQDTDLIHLAGIPKIELTDAIHPKVMKALPPVDRNAIEAGCSFIRHCRDTTEDDIREPQWYAMLSIVGRFQDGATAVHEYSCPQGNRHPKYSHAFTEFKVKHALEASGPRTCANISQMWEGCKTCPHYETITSPIQLRGPDTIYTQNNGFYGYEVDKFGKPKKGKPNYDDLVRWFAKNYEYVSFEENEQVMIYNGKYWEEISKLRIHKFAEDNFNPTPTSGMCAEFEAKLKRTNVESARHLIVDGKINFDNGVLDLESGELEPHDSKYKFNYIVPYPYEPKGDCPVFKKFLREVACEDEEIVQMLAEYIGYCVSGTDPELIQKVALLYGDGANGKSVLLGLMREMVGPQNCAAMSMASLGKETSRYQLMNKLFNACAESPKDSFLESEAFKGMATGDTIEVRRLYGDPVMWKCTTKLMFACNELPFNGDFSNGLYRRLIILPFRATFNDEIGNKDPLIMQKMLPERSDIFRYCLESFKQTKARGYKFIEPRASVEEMEDYKEMGDVVSRFVYSMCQYKETGEMAISMDNVYNLFCLWCKENNQSMLSYGSFARRVGKILGIRYPKVEKTRPRNEDGSRATGYKNLIIKATSGTHF